MSAESDLKEIKELVEKTGEHSTRALRDLRNNLRRIFGLSSTSVDEVVAESVSGGGGESEETEPVAVEEAADDSTEGAPIARSRTRSKKS